MERNLTKQIETAIRQHKQMVENLQARGAQAIAAAALAISDALRRNGRIYVCGNGGSAADAQHIASELVGKFQRERRALPAVALTTDTSAITSISNDYGYEQIFVRQVDAFVGEGDILWAISTSGASANIIAAARRAKEKGARVLAFTGKTDSTLEQMADICFCAESNVTARSQEIHQLAYHIICDLVEESFSKQ
ncbi:MAG: D-sedoheptulose-7-phosphate isomerase [Planctomycetota bacterium]|jgi:D-sedoheptulose 7-phosphate isomerase